MSENSYRGRGRGRGRGDYSHGLPIHSRGRGGGGRGDFRGGRGRGGGPPPEVEIFKQGDGQIFNPDQQVTRIEDVTAADTKKRVFDECNPPRPGYGTAGKEIVLWANYFKLVTEKNLELYRYSIDIRPGDDGRVPVGKKVKRIVQLLLEEHFFTSGLDIASDYKSNIVTRRKLKVEDEYLVVYRADDESEAAPNATKYRVQVQLTGSLSIVELIDHLTSSQAGSILGSKEEMIQALNIVMGHHPKALGTIASLARNRHFSMNPSAQDAASLGGGLQVIRGFFMSVRAATSRLLINVQAKHLAFFEDGPLDKIMHAYMSQNGPNKINLLRFVKKLSIEVTHIARKNKQGHRIPRIKTVQGFATKDDGRNLSNSPIVTQFGAGAKEVKFFLNTSSGDSSNVPSSGKKSGKALKAGPGPASQGSYVTVYDFFRQTYNITIKNFSLPVINVSTKDNPSYLPAEVCIVRPGQPAVTKLYPAQTQQMIRFAVRRPARNAQSIVTTGNRLLGLEQTNPTLDAFGINIESKLITVSGRVMNVPAIKYSNVQTTRPKFGSWDMRSVKFVKAATLPGWTYLRISMQSAPNQWRSDEDFSRKVNELQSKVSELGISVSNCMSGLHINVNAQNFEVQVDNALHKFAISARRPKLVLVIIPRENASIYNRVKYICDVKEGMLNVCVSDAKFCKANPQYLANVGLKINLKLGGINHSLDQSHIKFLQLKKTMVVGIDVTHPSPGSSSNAPSVAGIVASVDEHLGQWPAEIRIQKSRQEDVADLDVLFKSRLLVWKNKNNNALPENVLVYRDGVSEGQYDKVLTIELPALQKACTEVYPAPSTKAGLPRISIIIVGKRHNTRFYPTKKEDADRGGNPPNGTIVDRGVTEARNWDFFLQAHAAIQGTARPAHYYVVYDQIFRGLMAKAPAAGVPHFASAADALEDLTHNMCYLFGRATKAVSVCPPAYYADLVCTRARCYLSGLFDPSSLSSPMASSAGDASSVSTGGGGGAATAASHLQDGSMVSIHPNVKNAMFYI